MHPVNQLIRDTLCRKKMSRADLVRALGWPGSLVKNLRRIDPVYEDQLLETDFYTHVFQALEIPENEQRQTFAETFQRCWVRMLWDAANYEFAARRRFCPYLEIVIPHQRQMGISYKIALSAEIGNWWRIELSSELTRLPYDKQLWRAGDAARNHFRLKGVRIGEGIGQITGYVFQRTYDERINLSIDGEALSGGEDPVDGSTAISGAEGHSPAATGPTETVQPTPGAVMETAAKASENPCTSPDPNAPPPFTKLQEAQILLFIHDRGETGYSLEAIFLSRCFGAKRVHTPTLPLEPAASVERLAVMIDELGRACRRVVLVGKGAGGFLALHLANRFSLPVILLDPDLVPGQTGQDPAGRQTQPPQAEPSQWAEARAREWEPFQVRDTAPCDERNTLVLLHSGGADIDRDLIFKRLVQARFEVFAPGTPSPAALQRYLQSIHEFCSFN